MKKDPERASENLKTALGIGTRDPRTMADILESATIPCGGGIERCPVKGQLAPCPRAGSVLTLSFL
jgi:hypothetical protein